MEITVRMLLEPDDGGQERLRMLAERLHRLASAELSDELDRADVTTRMTVTMAAPPPIANAGHWPAARQADTVARPDPRSGSLVMLTGSREAVLNGARLGLTKIQFDLLLLLAKNAGQVLTRPQLLARTGDRPAGGCPRTIDVHVKRLRAKMGDEGPSITTIRGVGYRLDRPDQITVVDGR